jgi:hypothetical protein
MNEMNMSPPQASLLTSIAVTIEELSVRNATLAAQLIRAQQAVTNLKASLTARGCLA